MTINELKRAIKKRHQVFIKGSNETKQKRTLVRTIKLMEELGEFSNEVLACNTVQRQEKMKNEDKAKKMMAEELADVFIVGLLLAENADIDIWSEIERKLSKGYKIKK